MSMNLFERAARGKWRFPSTKGDLTVEQLLDLPLQSRNGFDLDTVARTLDDSLGNTTRSFVAAPSTNKEAITTKGQFDLVIYIIETKQAAAATAARREEKADQRRKLLEILDRKDNEELEGASREEILAKLAELDAE